MCHCLLEWNRRQTRDFIIPYSREDHVRRMSDPGVIYLRILKDRALVGFFILGLDHDATSVEFRRIVVATKGAASAKRQFNEWSSTLGTASARSRIWLDVFEHNLRARHIYEKLGYRSFGEGAHDSATLLL